MKPVSMKKALDQAFRELDAAKARIAELEAKVNRQRVGWTACYKVLKDAATAANCYHQALETLHGIEGLGIRAQTIINKALKSCEGRDA